MRLRSRSRIRVPTKKTRSWGINVAVNPVVNLPQTARGPHGGQGRGPEFAAKRKPRPPCAASGPGHSCEDIGQLSRNPMQPISRRRGHPRCSGNLDARGCVVGDGGAPFMGVFHKKIGVVDGQGRGLILVAPARGFRGRQGWNRWSIRVGLN